jgi:hypothetical protein
MATGWEEVGMIGCVAVFGMVLVGAMAWPDLRNDGALPPLSDTELSLNLPEHCQAKRTTSGYVMTCDEVPDQDSGSYAATSRLHREPELAWQPPSGGQARR